MALKKKVMLLTNKSLRVYMTGKGKFFPGTSKEFDEKEALRLLGYGHEIVKADKAMGAEVEKMVKEKDEHIAKLEASVETLKEDVKALKKLLKENEKVLANLEKEKKLGS